ncbi:MAG: endonuclease III [Candidatus Bathyarchaeota archaeon]|nr:MAG: endonuclease III [Candidatus Bathyarchaeota archaeon]
MNTKERAACILHELQNTFSLSQSADSSRMPFRTLIRTVLSQATADVTSDRAFQNLSERFPITPTVLANADAKEIEEAIRVAGLYRNKSKAIKNLSQVILDQFDGALDFIYTLPVEEARRKLVGLPGVGAKTADVVLLFCTESPVIPVDTHVNRVSRRLGLAPLDGNYEEIREALQNLYQPKEYLLVHLLLISLGRKYCMARRILCRSCPVNTMCPSRKNSD